MTGRLETVLVGILILVAAACSDEAVVELGSDEPKIGRAAQDATPLLEELSRTVDELPAGPLVTIKLNAAEAQLEQAWEAVKATGFEDEVLEVAVGQRGALPHRNIAAHLAMRFHPGARQRVEEVLAKSAVLRPGVIEAHMIMATSKSQREVLAHGRRLVRESRAGSAEQTVGALVCGMASLRDGSLDLWNQKHLQGEPFEDEWGVIEEDASMAAILASSLWEIREKESLSNFDRVVKSLVAEDWAIQLQDVETREKLEGALADVTFEDLQWLHNSLRVLRHRL